MSVTVTQADREAAHEWKWLLCDSEDFDPNKEMERNVSELAQDFARHREQAERDAEARIVAWLRGPTFGDQADWNVASAGEFADAIEQGAHKQ